MNGSGVSSRGDKGGGLIRELLLQDKSVADVAEMNGMSLPRFAELLCEESRRPEIASILNELSTLERQRNLVRTEYDYLGVRRRLLQVKLISMALELPEDGKVSAP